MVTMQLPHPTSPAVEPQRIGAWRSVPITAIADVGAVKQDLTFINPAIEKAAKMGMDVPPGTTRQFVHWRQEGDRLLVPRHYIPRMRRPAPETWTFTPNTDNTRPFEILIEPRDGQQEMIDWLARPEDGRFMISMGKGKTSMALMALNDLNVFPALVVVHTEGLLEQWRQRFVEQTTLTPFDIGLVKGAKADFHGKPVVLAMMQTLSLGEDRTPEKFDDLKAYMRGGVVIYDELDVYPAEKMSKCLHMFESIRWGLTATYRHDGLQPVLAAHIGGRELYHNKYELKPTVVLCKIPVPGWMCRYSNMQSLLTKLENSDNAYRRGLRDLVLKAQAKGRKTALLMQRVEGIETMAAELVKLGVDAAPIHGKTKRKDRVERFSDRRVIVGNRSIVGRGADSPELDSIITGPAGDPAAAIQIVGRALRQHGDKLDPVVVITIPWHPSGGQALGVFHGVARKMINNLRRLGFAQGDHFREVTLKV